MKCTHCGAYIQDDRLRCPVCGAEIRFVPDYNPLDDVLAREVKGSVEGAARQLRTEELRRQSRSGQPVNVRVPQIDPERMYHNKTSEGRRTTDAGKSSDGRRITDAGKSSDGRRTADGRRTTDSRRESDGKRSAEGGGSRNDRVVRRSPEERRRQQELRLAAAKRKRRKLLTAMFVILALIGAGIYIIYQNSYTGVMKKGYRALQSGDYSRAAGHFNRAIIKDRSRPEAYTGLSEIYLDQGDQDSAESVFLSVIETQPSNVQLYQAAIDFYVKTERYGDISILLADCDDDGVLSAVSDYVSEAPEFGLASGTYEEVIEVSLTSETGGDIYYTTDGSDPTTSDTVYTEPILLNTEAETEIRAIAVNENGIPSVVVSAEYTIAFPIADAPAVNPATGQYTEPEQIIITVPDGYTAYYTTDGTTPSPDSSTSYKYTGPVDMPENDQIIFNAILVNDDNGKETAVTTRNYITTDD